MNYELAFSAFLAWLLVLMIHRFRRRWRELPPGPCGWPFIGSFFMIYRHQSRHRIFAKLAQHYGPIMFLRLGSRPTIVISTSNLAQEVFKKHDAEFASRPCYATTIKHISYNFHDLVFAPYGARWQHLRRICSTELFTTTKVNMFAGIRNNELSTLASTITTSSNQIVNISLLLQEFFTNLMSSVLCGKRFFSKDVKEVVEADGYRKIWGMLSEEHQKMYIGDYIPSLGWVDQLHRADHRLKTTVMPALRSFMNAIVEDHKNRQLPVDTPSDFVDVLLSLRGADKISDTTVISVIQDMLLAGTGTSKATLEWGFSELMLNPGVLCKAQTEIDHVVGSKSCVQEEDLKNMPYIQAIVKEIMRLHPPVPLGLPHFNPNAVHMAGYTIPPNSTLIVNIWAISRDPNVWKDPLNFCPERFLNTDHNLLGQHFDLIPFSSGRRRCAGISLAIPQVTFALAYLLHRFHWRLPVEIQQVDMTEKTGIACTRLTPLFLIASPR